LKKRGAIVKADMIVDGTYFDETLTIWQQMWKALKSLTSSQDLARMSKDHFTVQPLIERQAG
jgi:hypothetical protein